MNVHAVLASIVAVVGLSGTAAQAVVIADFEGGSTSGFGSLTNAGVVPSASNTVVTPASGSNLTKVLSVAASGYNNGQSSGANVGYDFAANGTAAQFLANDILSFNWEVPPSPTTSGYAQLFEVVLNAPGLGYRSIYSLPGDPNTTHNQYPGYTGQTRTFTFDYSALKSQISANPGYLQLGIVTNNGGGAPLEFYFDNFQVNLVPEPASLAALGLGGVALAKRRRRAR